MASSDKTFTRHSAVLIACPVLFIVACLVGWWQWTSHAAEQYAWVFGVGSGIAVLAVGGLLLFMLALANLANGTKSMLHNGRIASLPHRRRFSNSHDEL